MNTLLVLWALAAADPVAAETPPAAALAASATVEGTELGRTEGLIALGAGIALGVTSMAAFAAGFEAERQLRAGEVQGPQEQSAALTQRGVAALVAWPAAALSVAAVVGGGWLIAEDGAL